MDVKRGRMVFLGYGKYWRSDRILGLMPIEEGRGPGQRTNVFIEGRPEPIVASRTEQSILEDMGATDDSFRLESRGDARAAGSVSRILTGTAPGAAQRASFRRREMGGAARRAAPAGRASRSRTTGRSLRLKGLAPA